MCYNLRISVCLTYIPNRGFQASGGFPQTGHRGSVAYVRIYSGPGLPKKGVPCSGAAIIRIVTWDLHSIWGTLVYETHEIVALEPKKGSKKLEVSPSGCLSQR